MGKLSTLDENQLELVQRQFMKKISFPGYLQYHERLEAAGLLIIQRNREKLILLHLVKKIRNNNIGNIGIQKGKFNTRTDLRLETCKHHFKHKKTQTLEEKTFTYHAGILVQLSFI